MKSITKKTVKMSKSNSKIGIFVASEKQPGKEVLSFLQPCSLCFKLSLWSGTFPLKAGSKDYSTIMYSGFGNYGILVITMFR